MEQGGRVVCRTDLRWEVCVLVREVQVIKHRVRKGGEGREERLADWGETESSVSRRSLHDIKKNQAGGGLREQVGEEIAFTMAYWRDTCWK